MIKEHIKEQLSNNFIGLIASKLGYTIGKDNLDYGVDITLKKIVYRKSGNNKKRYSTPGYYMDLQLKSTTLSKIKEKNNVIKYALDVDNYNDLVDRFEDSERKTPLILILFVLPDDDNMWIDVTDKELILRKCAYWYMPNKKVKHSENSSSITIEIPISNRLEINTLTDLFNKFYTL